MREFISPLDEAKYRVVHDYPGGATRLAPLVRMRPGTLSNKVNPDLDSHHLTVDEAVSIQHTARDFRILTSEAFLLNHACIPLADFTGTNNNELLIAYAKYHAEVGETARAIADALEDNRLTRKEVERIKQEGFQDIQMFMTLVARLEAVIDD